MGKINVILFVTWLCLISCDVNQESHDIRPTEPSADSVTQDVSRSGSELKISSSPFGFYYKKSLWLKAGAAIVLSAKEGHGIVFNPTKYTVVDLNGRLTAWDAAGFSNSGCDCGPNEVCINGVCQPVSPCGGGCPAGTTCVNGICAPNDPCGGGCPQGQVCINGTCTSNDPCDECGPDETCINGTCMPTDPCADCPPGSVCINGDCQAEECDCEEDEICVNGQCEPLGGGGDIGQVQF